MSTSNEEYIASEVKSLLGENLLEVKIPRPRRLFLKVSREAYKQAAKHLIQNMNINHVSTITAADSGKEMDVMAYLFGRGVEVTLKATVPKEDPKIPTLTDIVPGATFYEREVFDLFGIVFEGHPNLERLILPEDWPAGVYPLRKEYKVTRLKGPREVE
ncbi:MAG: NADH-quinone oxidoreductase subunit C [Candidatus Bathyarchaeia archaeon]|nr:NADH-quinone oxidoreductase subunit C [Candidatus Bathyarchaeota archaeon]